MTWTRLDDRWTERPDLADLTHEVRWHYLSLIQFCSRTGRLDGFLRPADARRCSDVDDPDAAHEALALAGLLDLKDGQLQVREIHDHVPPPSVRNASDQTKIRMRRSRAHASGDHSLCLPEHCPASTVTDLVTGEVTRNTGTGQDRTLTTEPPRESAVQKIERQARPAAVNAASTCACGSPLTTTVTKANGMCNSCWRAMDAQRKKSA